MIRKSAPCGNAEARARIQKANDFLEVAELAVSELFDPAASNAVIAGVAASDAVCCHRLGKRSSGADHREAVRLLSAIDREMGVLLARLLAVKHKAQYDHQAVGEREAEIAVRRARRLVEFAQRTLAT